MNTDLEWEKWGRQDPYYGVLTNPKFRKGEMTEEAKQEFLHSGRYHVEQVINACRKYVDPSFNPRRVLDFGCGVGRLVLPFAALADEVVGVDISEAMLAEARNNCREHGVDNAIFVKSDDVLSGVTGLFDLVHTAIVLQHIDPHRGTQIVAELLARIMPGGLAAIQLTYGKAYHAETLGAIPPLEPPRVEPPMMVAAKATPWLRKLFGRPPMAGQVEVVVEAFAASAAEALVIEAPAKDPEMLMNPYDLNVLFFMMQSAGVTDFHTEFTDHGGELGVFLYFRKA